MNIGYTTEFQSSLPRRQVTIAMVGTMLSMFVGSLYMTIVSTAMPRIVTDLGGFSQYTWVFTSYFIPEVISIPIAGKLSDMYGRKWFFVAGLAIFVVASFFSGMSQTMMQLIIFRGLQGLGFGVVMSLSFIVIADLYPPMERGKYHGWMSLVFALSTIIGPTLGGYLTEYLSWRWCFFVNMPLGVIIIILFVFFYPKTRPDHLKHRVDYGGVVMIILSVVPLMLALTWGGIDYDWLSPVILGLLCLSVLMFALFILVESRAAEPIIPLELFRNRVVLVSSISIFFMGLAFFIPISFVPLYFQGVLGASAAESGGFFTPMMFSSALSGVVSGQLLSRTAGHYRLQGTIAFLVVATGLFLLSTMTVETGYGVAIIYIVLVGLGFGFMMPLYPLAVQNSVPHSVLGAATSLINWLRMFAGIIGLSIVGSIMNNRFNSEFMENLPPSIKAFVSPEKLASIVDNPQALINPEAHAQMQNLFNSLGAQGAVLFERLLTTLREALSAALAEVFLVVFGAAVLGLIANFFLKGIPSYKRVQDENLED